LDSYACGTQTIKRIVWATRDLYKGPMGDLTPDQQELFNLAATDEQAAITLALIQIINTSKTQCPMRYGTGGPCVAFASTFNTTLDNVVPIDTQNDWKNEGVSVSLKTWKTGSSIPTVVAGIPLPFNLSTGHQIITITIKDPVTDATIGQAFVDYGTNGGLGIWGPLQGNSGGSDGIWFPGNGLDDQANDIFNAQFDAMNSDPRMNYRYGAGH
jgi:hypothetical protein